MHETAEDLARLQDELDRSFESAGSHLAGIFGADRLSATDLVARWPGIVEIHLAVTTSDGAPMVAPIDAQLFRGRVWFGLPGASVRARLLRRDARVSASYADGSFGLIVHGVARETEDEAYTRFVTDLYVAQYGPQFLEWQKARSHEGEFTGWIEARRVFAKG